MRVSHTAELYTYCHEQPAIGNWCIMTFSNCRTIYLFSWAACYWEMIHYYFLTLQNYTLTFLSSLLLGNDTLWLSHTAELYTYFLEQPAFGKWYTMTFSHCRTIYLLSWAACYWKTIHFEILLSVEQESHVTAYHDGQRTDPVFSFCSQKPAQRTLKWNYPFSSIYPPLSPKHYTLKLLHREIEKTKKKFVTEIRHNKIRKAHQNYEITMYSTTDINWNGSAN